VQPGLPALRQERVVDGRDQVVLPQAGPDALLQQLAGAVAQLRAAAQPRQLLVAADPADPVEGAAEVLEARLREQPAQLLELAVGDRGGQ
jgi:hypothetical protein